MPLSDDAFKKYVSNWPKSNKDIHGWVLRQSTEPEAPVAEPEPEPRRGDFIYVPHDCDLPDREETRLGSIWACHGYRDGRMCHDQWILEVAGGDRRWSLFKRSMRG